MDSINPLWPFGQRFHLLGGGRVTTALDGAIAVWPAAVDGRECQINSADYSGVTCGLWGEGLIALGVDLMSDAAHYREERPPDWGSIYLNEGATPPKTLCRSLAEQWTFVAHAAFKRKRPAYYDISRRVSYQLRVCDWRLRQVSECYRDQLLSRLRSGFKHGDRFENEYTWFVALSIQTFLVDACVLRDYLAELYYRIYEENGEPISNTVITRMSKLKSAYVDTADPTLPLVAILKEATAAGGWLHEFGQYRDLVVHSTPLQSAGKRVPAVCWSQRTVQGVSVPLIRYPMPLDPQAISKARTQGTHLSDPTMEFARFSHLIENHEEHVDGLEYCYLSQCRLTWLSSQLFSASPIKPEVPSFTIGKDGKMTSDQDAQ